ncbi:MAG: hypothetical protein V7L25_10280 [Nostoc sp.]|uniref:hypothetical protein n=1 Tax=Nostoc sp. TaxID=1180 RepID=UPI002FF0618C
MSWGNRRQTRSKIAGSIQYQHERTAKTNSRFFCGSTAPYNQNAIKKPLPFTNGFDSWKRNLASFNGFESKPTLILYEVTDIVVLR